MANARVKQTLASPAGFSVVGLLAHRNLVYVSDAQSNVRVAARQPDGSYRWDKVIELAKPSVAGAAHPAGMCLLPGEEAWVASTRC